MVGGYGLGREVPPFLKLRLQAGGSRDIREYAGMCLWFELTHERLHSDVSVVRGSMVLGVIAADPAYHQPPQDVTPPRAVTITRAKPLKHYGFDLFLKFVHPTGAMLTVETITLIAPIAHFFQAASVFSLGLPSHGTVTFTSLHFTGELRCLHKRR